MDKAKEVLYSIKNLGEKLGKKVINEDYVTAKKISVRSEYITKMRRAYHKFLAKHYMNEEAKLLSKKASYSDGETFDAIEGDKLQNVVENKQLHLDKLQENNEKLQEIERLRSENQAVSAMEENVVEIPTVQEVNVDSNVVQPVEPIVVEQEVPVMSSAVEPIEVQPVVTEENVVEIPVVPTMEESNVITDAMPMQNEGIEVTQTAKESLQQPTNNLQDMNPVIQASLAQNVQRISAEEKGEVDNSISIDDVLKQYNEYNMVFEESWSSSIKNIMELVKDHSSQIQKVSLEALASKQKELDNSKAQNIKLQNDNQTLNHEKTQLTNELVQKNGMIEQMNREGAEKDRTIQNLQLEGQNKDQIINNQKAQISEKDQKIAKLENDMNAMSQQFKQMQEMFNNFQAMMGNAMQQNADSMVNEGVQKKLS